MFWPLFWHLFLAHLLADYPLQPYWIVLHKDRWWVLGLHVATHFLVTFVLVGAARTVVWPYILLLALIHYLLDRLKIASSRWWPSWVILPYAIDQALHLMLLAWITSLMLRQVTPGTLPLGSIWVIYAIAYLLVTHVWFVSERILAYADREYREKVNETAWPRMLARAGILSLALVGWNALAPPRFAGVSPVWWPYRPDGYRRRELFTDVSVSLGGLIFIWLALPGI
jgi:hypothetical protein